MNEEFVKGLGKEKQKLFGYSNMLICIIRSVKFIALHVKYLCSHIRIFLIDITPADLAKGIVNHSREGSAT